MATVRKATRQDIPEILALYEELTGEKQRLSPDTIDRVFTQITASPNQNLLVAEKDGAIAGTVFLQIVPNLTHGAQPWAFLENMVVDKNFRRQGVGRRLIEYAFARTKEAGCYKIQLLSHKKRHDAHKFYRALGFQDSALGFRLYFLSES